MTKKNKKRVFYFYTLLSFLIIFFGYRIYGSFSKSVWDGVGRISLALAGDQTAVFSLDPQEKSGVLILLPPETFIEVIHGYGSYKVEAVYGLGELEGHRGGELLKDSLQENLSLPIDGYASIADCGLRITDYGLQTKDLGKIFISLLGKGDTNLTNWDLLRIWWETKNLREDKITLVKLEEKGVLIEKELPDGSKGFDINSQAMEKTVLHFFKDSQIRHEDLPIAVLNNTSHSGLALRGAKIIQNIRGRVVDVGDIKNGEIKLEKCQVKSKKELKKSYTVRKLSKIFNCQWSGENIQDSPADVVLVLGEEYWKKLVEKW